MIDVAAMLLAAGLSRRMGKCNELLLPIGDLPMIRHMVDTYHTISNQPVIVVTGHETEVVEAALVGSSATTVFNPDFAAGQATSVVCGIRAANPACDVLIGLGDQPLLTSDDLQALLVLHAATGASRISIPLHGGQRGNPIVVPASLRTRLLADPRSPGCKTFTRAHPEHVQFHPLQAPGFYTDVDTPDAYDAVLPRSLEKTQ